MNVYSSTKNYNHALKEIKRLKNNYSAKVIFLDINHSLTVEKRYEYLHILQKLKAMNFLLTLEDLSSEVFPADIVIIPYVGAESLKIQKKWITISFRSKYFPIREEFIKVKRNNTPIKNVKTILISMGGSDPKKITIKVVKALSKLKYKVHLKVVLGILSQISNDQIKTLLKNYVGNFQVIRNIQNMAELMNESQIAITNSGLTKYEMASMGLPAIVISNTKHAELMDDFAKYGTLVHLGNNEKVTEENIFSAVTALMKDEIKRGKMSIAGKQLVDGNGFERIFNYIPDKLIFPRKDKKVCDSYIYEFDPVYAKI